MSFYLFATLISGILFSISYIGGAQLVDGIHNRVACIFSLLLFTVIITACGIIFVMCLSKLTACIVFEIINYAINLVF